MSYPFDEFHFGSENDLRHIWENNDPLVDYLWTENDIYDNDPYSPGEYPCPISQNCFQPPENLPKTEQIVETTTENEPLLDYGEYCFWANGNANLDLDVSMTDAFRTYSSYIGRSIPPKTEQPVCSLLENSASLASFPSELLQRSPEPRVEPSCIPSVEYINDDIIEAVTPKTPDDKVEEPQKEKKLKRKFDIESTDYFILEECDMTSSQLISPEEDDPTNGFKLPASKSPIMEAMVVCALNGWGIELVKHSMSDSSNPEIVFRVLDFDRYYKISRSICSKQRPTDDVGSRVKSLRRWFINFPKKKVRCEKGEFLLTVKPQISKKVSEIIERNTRVLGLSKRRRRQ